MKNIVSGKLVKPVKVLIHGTAGVGKSTFASNAPFPIFLCSEDGTSELNISRFPVQDSFDGVLSCIDQLATEEHSFRTFVIDSMDWLEPIIWRKCCQVHNKASIESFGYKTGYIHALDWWRILLSSIERLRATKDMHVVLIAHSSVRTFNDPEQDSYDRYELKLHPKAAGLLIEWCDAVLFASFDRATRKDGDKSKGVSTGERIMRTELRAAFDAKNRYGLPFRMPLSWQEFQNGVKKSRTTEK
jgi:hypothetical protein